ncbi:MAG: hypothetical protein ACLP1X_33010 [Polyangiaceae bacterium]
MTPEKPQRATVGVVACAVSADRGMRLVFDDVHATSAVYPQAWRSVAFFTETTVDRATLEACRFTDEQLTDIGRALVARLAALAKELGVTDAGAP